ncbi:MAG: ATP-binding protein [Myxococcales bacterium]|nr:MAG: ATP-binding protein [Myxococcales bacterium]
MNVAASPLSVIAGTPTGSATALAAVLHGLEPHLVQVEVTCSRGPGGFQLVGLAEAAVKESRVRVSGALAHLGVLLNEYAVTVNLAPADLRKSGAALDVAIALGTLAAVGRLEPSSLHGVLFIGELSLDGALRPVTGVLPRLNGAASEGVRSAIVPPGNAAEAGLSRGVQVLVAGTLQRILEHLSGQRLLATLPPTKLVPQPSLTQGDLAEVRGQTSARRSLELAAAGAHNLLLLGPPGSGKTLLARLLPTVLPPLDVEEAIECTTIHSVAGTLPSSTGVVTERPFRAPHHSVSDAGLVGGGDLPRPGEVSLAHHGVLFLDELAEFRRSAIEALRQPLEDGRVCIARARARAWFPARPLVVAAVNPCPCGHWGHPRLTCKCSEFERKRYRARLSGPLLDRIDIHVQAPPVEVAALMRRSGGESSARVRERVTVARERQKHRSERLFGAPHLNASLPARYLEAIVRLDDASRSLLEDAVPRLGLSARAFNKILRVARTAADLEGEAEVLERHVVEGVQGRVLDREPTL